MASRPRGKGRSGTLPPCCVDRAALESSSGPLAVGDIAELIGQLRGAWPRKRSPFADLTDSTGLIYTASLERSGAL